MTAWTTVPSRDVAASVAEWGRPDRDLPTWRGRPCQQFPADLWRYAEWCWELQPAFVVEVGVADGGTTLFLADTLTAIGSGIVVAIDVDSVALDHPEVVAIWGDATSDRIIREVRDLAGHDRGLVLLDGDHDPDQVARELELYAPLADALVVEDTIMRWLPQYSGAGPLDALGRWLPDHPEWTFAPDPVPGPTQHPGGWLRRRP